MAENSLSSHTSDCNIGNATPPPSNFTPANHRIKDTPATGAAYYSTISNNIMVTPDLSPEFLSDASSPSNNSSNSSFFLRPRQYRTDAEFKILIERIKQLESTNNALINKVQELSSKVSHSPKYDTTNLSSSVCNTVKFKRIFIFCDSMGRNISSILSDKFPKLCSFYSLIKPGALFSQVISSISKICYDFGPNDMIIILGGTNDMIDCPPNTSRYLNISALKPLLNKTNIILNNIPYRYDEHAQLSTNICETNKNLELLCKRNNIIFFQSNQLLNRSHFTRHGLHYNKKGKYLIASELAKILSNMTKSKSIFSPSSEISLSPSTSFSQPPLTIDTQPPSTSNSQPTSITISPLPFPSPQPASTTKPPPTTNSQPLSTALSLPPPSPPLPSDLPLSPCTTIFQPPPFPNPPTVPKNRRKRRRDTPINPLNMQLRSRNKSNHSNSKFPNVSTNSNKASKQRLNFDNIPVANPISSLPMLTPMQSIPTVISNRSDSKSPNFQTSEQHLHIT
ncbi:hypothetical protein M8J76_013629 [Diaphorina citri]|nr:hypothetical protein M8J76_013629 [Diaphorina citri]KAI5747973.1 hypothetical protein M8J77_020579 [Diaphorina citri]